MKNWRSRQVEYILAVFVCVSVLAGCSASNGNPEDAKMPAGSASLTGAGSTFSSLLFDRWLTAYHDTHPTTSVTYASVGSGEGVRRFIGKNVEPKDSVDFGASDSAMSDAQLAETDNNTLMVPITAGCVVLAYHLPNFHGVLKLTREAYAGIFLGEVKNWNDPLIARANPDLKMPDLSIAPVVRLDSSGTTFAFTGNLSAISDKWRSRFGQATLVSWPGGAMQGNGNEGVASLIQNSEGSIGYIGLEFARRLDLDLAALENKEHTFVQPSEGSCAAGLATAEFPDNLRVFVPDPSGGNSYPIVTYSWALLRKTYSDPRTASALRDLFTWCLFDGQKYASQLGYVPLPAEVVEKARTTLSNVKAGS